MKLLLFISILLTFQSIGQGNFGYLFEEMPADSILPPSLSRHSTIKPTIRISQQGENELSIKALTDFNYLQKNSATFKTGVGAEINAQMNNKWHIRLMAVQGATKFDSSFISTPYILSPTKTIDWYTDIHARTSYTPNKFFNFQIGLDNNFIGEGSRSMLISDYSSPYPFAMVRTNFWRIEYAVLYQFMRERKLAGYQAKFASSHHLSINAAKWLNFGIFESVIFQPKDTLLNRGFDAEYLNPFVFYRPQEYSLGSSDNVLLGVDLTANYKHHTFYSQFILDEFYLAEIRAKSGWWANKFGGQIGIKGRFGNSNEFFYRVEYNFARPYTFSHLSEELNYGNQGRSLAHPYGSSFMEGLAELKWQKDKLAAKYFINYYLKGGDNNGFNYGADIYQSYVNRPSEYGHFTGQGRQQNGLNSAVTFSYRVLKNEAINAFIESHLNYSVQQNSIKHLLVVGLRSYLWNDYRNY